MTDDGLRPQAEDARRFEAVFDATYRRVLAYALRRADDRGSAEEVVSETYLVAWRRLEALPEEPLPWLLRTARLLIANQRRSARRRRHRSSDPTSDLAEVPDLGSPPLERIVEREAFASAFAELSDRDREVLTLIAWDGLTVREAAEVMGCTAATFSIRLHRARKRLANELRASGHSIGEQAKRPSIGDQARMPEAQ